MACEARQEGDEMACPCGLRWSVSDLNPPPCRRVRHVVPVPAAKRELLVGARREAIEANFILCTGDKHALRPEHGDRRFTVVNARLPAEAPLDLARAMQVAYEAARTRGEEPHKAMARAYRVLLDAVGG